MSTRKAIEVLSSSTKCIKHLPRKAKSNIYFVVNNTENANSEKRHFTIIAALGPIANTCTINSFIYCLIKT